MPGAFRGDQRRIDSFGRKHLAEVHVEAVRAEEQVPLAQVGPDFRPEQVPLNFVGEQNVDDIGALGRLGEREGLEAVAHRQVVVRRSFTLPDNDIAAAVAEVLRLGMSLAAVAENGDRLVLQKCQIGVVVVINFRGHCSHLSLCRLDRIE